MDLFRQRVAPLLPLLTDVPSPHFPGRKHQGPTQVASTATLHITVGTDQLL